MTTFYHSWDNSAMIFTRDFITRENHCRIASLMTEKSLYMVTHVLFRISFMKWVLETIANKAAQCQACVSDIIR